MSLAAWLARHATYPLHERLRGRPTLRTLQALQDLCCQSPADVARLAAERLRALLAFAAARLPYYAEVLARQAVRPDAPDLYDAFVRLPVLRKADIRRHAAGMRWADVPGGPIRHSSGGTTGDTLAFHIDRTRQAEDLAARLFMQGLYGVRPGDRRLHLWGSPIEARGGRLKRWRDRLLNEFLISAFDLAPAQLEHHLATLHRLRPAVLYGYPTAAVVLAQHAAARYGPRDFPWLKLIVLTGEEVTAEQRDQVRAVFGCPVGVEYGNREVGLIAHTCPQGTLHTLAPHIYVEILPGPQPAQAEVCGEIVCTTLNVRAQPFIRYRLGDVGGWPREACSCGLPLPALRLVGGKVTGFIALPGGRLCHGAVTSHILRGEPGIVAFKTYQRALDEFEVLLATGPGFDSATCARIRERYRRLFGAQVTVDVRLVDEIPPDPSGKHRYVVSAVAPQYDHFELVAPTADL